jgi:hypothetical protein
MLQAPNGQLKSFGQFSLGQFEEQSRSNPDPYLAMASHATNATYKRTPIISGYQPATNLPTNEAANEAIKSSHNPSGPVSWT